LIPHGEWLNRCKQLPIGQTRRVYHAAESRPNLVLKNMEAYWSVYCHACHTGDRVNKEYVKVQAAVVAPPTRDAGFLRRITLYEPDPNIPYDKLSIFLHSKHMCVDYFAHLNPMWSAQDYRLVFHTADQVVGRDITGKANAKWHKYSGDVSYVRAKPAALTGYNSVLLTEDLLSACKAQYFAPDDWSCIAMMGTTMYPDLLALLIGVRNVVVMLDGDKAGQEGAAKVLRALRLVGIPAKTVTLGLLDDPKDQTQQWWRNFYDHA